MENQKRIITREELGKNNGIGGKPHWIMMNNKIYDVTGYDHPGGTEVFDDNTEDKLEEFNATGHSKTAKGLKDQFFIGYLED